MKHDIHIQYKIAAPAEKVFAALTEAKQIKAWSGQDGVAEPEVGGVFSYFDGWATGKVVKFEPGKLLSHTWRVPEWGEAAADSIVTYRLDEQESGITITLDHINLPSEKERKSHEQGWYDYVLGPLKDYLENR